MDYSVPYMVRLDHLISKAELRSSVSVPPVSIRAGTISIFVEGNKLQPEKCRIKIRVINLEGVQMVCDGKGTIFVTHKFPLSLPADHNSSVSLRPLTSL